MTRCGSCGGGTGGGGSTACTCFTTDNCEAADEFFVDLPGTTGNYASTPDSVANSITGDIDIRIKVALDDWTPATDQTTFSKLVTTGNQRSWRLYVEADGDIVFSNSQDGITSFAVVNWQGAGLTNGQTIWLRATHDVDNGAGSHTATIYSSSDGEIWTQRQTSTGVGIAGTFSPFNSTSPVEIGSFNNGTAGNLAANVYYAEIRNGINGTVVARFDPDDSAVEPVPPTQTPSSFISSTGELWTINGAAWTWGVTEDSNCVIAEGNGSISHPFQFHSSDIPNPRPFGYIYQTAQQSNFGNGFTMPFSTNDNGIAGGMADVVAFPTRLTAPVDGVYMIGAFVAISADATDYLRIRLIKNGTISSSNPPINLGVEVFSDTTTRLYSLMTLFSLVAGDYFELLLNGSATMDAIVTEGGDNLRPTMWALWVGGS